MKKLALAAAVLACSCVTVDVTHPARARAEDCHLDALTLTPAFPFEEIGSVTAPRNATPSGFVDFVRAKACHAGADAVIVHGSNQRGTLIRYTKE